MKKTNFTAISWEKLKSAAAVRKDCVYENLKEIWKKGPLGVVYHKSCYSDYMHKGHLERVIKKRLLTEYHSQPGPPSFDDEPSLKKGCRHSRLHVKQTVLRKCIIYQNERKTAPKKAFSRYEDLTDCATFKAGDTLLNEAKIREDNRLILALEGHDYIANVDRHHLTCYQRYTHIKELDKLLEFERREEVASE